MAVANSPLPKPLGQATMTFDGKRSSRAGRTWEISVETERAILGTLAVEDLNRGKCLMSSKLFDGRSLTSLLTLASFLMLVVTGIIAYVAPQGRIAYWVDWRFAGLTKTHWGNIHIITGLLFVVAGSFHIYFNWKPLLNYLKGRMAAGAHRWRELVVTIALAVALVAGTIADVPPFRYVFDLNDYVKDSWIKTPKHIPPFGHAELLSLAEFTRKMRIDLDAATARLREAGIVIDGSDQTLAAIAETNRTSPMFLFEIIKSLSRGWRGRSAM